MNKNNSLGQQTIVLGGGCFWLHRNTPANDAINVDTSAPKTARIGTGSPALSANMRRMQTKTLQRISGRKRWEYGVMQTR
jgi:hypothetical protein